MSHIQAVDLLQEARENGQEDPYFLLSRLKNEIGLSDSRSRAILRMQGFQIDDHLIDPRCDTSSSRSKGGFVRRYA